METNPQPLTEEQLATIQKCASLFVEPRKIAFLIGMDADAFRLAIKDPQHPAYDPYNRGKLAAELKIRDQEMTLAQVGSPLALENISRARIEMEDDE